MTLEVFEAVTDEFIELMTQTKIREMEELTHLILRMASVVSGRYEQVDKPTLVARLVNIKFKFESFDDCFDVLKRSLMTIIIDE